jgi:signal transduction histidine kinase
VAIHIIKREKGVLPSDSEETIGAAHGKLTEDTISFPLTVRGKEVGQLVIANRGPGLAFDQVEIRLLKNIAQQAGAAVYAVQLTNDLKRSRQQIVTAREEERRRLRRDLHDGIGPTLAGQMLKLDATLDLLQSQGLSGHGQSQDEVVQLLTSVKQQTKESIARIRQIVYDLRPPALDDLGLVPAIRTQVAGYKGVESAPDITVSSNPEKLPQLPAAVEIAIYRIASEAITNIIQHAQAEYAHIKLTLSSHPAQQIELEVADTGRGLPEEPSAGVGLTSIRERVEELGGSFKIRSGRPSGTMIQVTIPLISKIDRDGYN